MSFEGYKIGLKRIVASVSIAAFCALAVFAPLANAETYISPELVHISTPVYRPDGGVFEPQLGTYTYNVSWQGIPAATVTATVEHSGLNYRIETVAKTATMIDIFYKLRYRAEGLISAIDYFPIHTRIEHKENSRDRLIEIDFRPNGEIESVRKDLVKDETKTLKFDPGNFTLDPFSAAFLARSLKWEKGETKEFDTFNGKSRYHIKLFAEDRKQIVVNGELKDCWVIKPTVKNLSTPEQSSKLRDASIYVTTDKAREVVKIVSSVFIGSVTTKMVGFKPSDKPVPGTHIAASGVSNMME